MRIHSSLAALLLAPALGLLVACGGGSSGSSPTPAAPVAPKLTALTVSASSLSPVFAPDTTLYTVAGLTGSSLTVTPTAEPGATVEVNGTAVASGAASAPVTLSPGSTAIEVKVSRSGLATSYFLNAQRTTTGPLLADLVSSVGTLSPAFNPTVGFYTLNAGTAPSLTLTPTAAESGTTLTVNGAPVTSGSASAPLPLAPGPNVLRVDLTQGGLTRTVNVLVHRTGPQLAGLALSTSELLPAFSPSTPTYTVPTVFDATFAVTPTAADPTNLVEVNGVSVTSGMESTPVTLTAGADNVVEVKLTTLDGYTTSYFLHVRAVGQEAYLKASNADAGDSFGGDHAFATNLHYTIIPKGAAISGDVAIVGAPREQSATSAPSDNSGTDVGAAYIYRRVAGHWVEEAYLKAPTPISGATFGFNVAIDGTVAVVGDRLGHVYIYRYNGAQWVGETTLAVSHVALALRGNVLALGDPADSTGATDAGIVRMYRYTGGTWQADGLIQATVVANNALFGSAVDLDGEGSLAVGAPGESSLTGDPNDASGSMVGAAYVFRYQAGAWTQEHYFKPTTLKNDLRFGASVSLSGEALAVGAPTENSPTIGINGDPTGTTMTASGAAYVFRKGAGGWSQEAFIKSSHTNMGMLFGTHVALSGSRLFVGGFNDSFTVAGAAARGGLHAFRFAPGGWKQEAFVKPTAANASTTAPGFGFSVATDGVSLIVGAPRSSSGARTIDGNADDTSALGAGAAYIYR
jgi:hypothetical protein